MHIGGLKPGIVIKQRFTVDAVQSILSDETLTGTTTQIVMYILHFQVQQMVAT